ncbi:MAG: hypothetical protein QF464_14475, partial [Myxococcota bacterium]|nr:hypothetical protein [Myxococcota bacterium]
TPGGVRAKLNKERHVEIAWSPTFGTDAVTYVVERMVAGSTAPPTRVSPASIGIRDRAFVDTAPPLEGPPLSYRVIAVDAASAHSAPSPWVQLPDLRRAPAVALAPARRGSDGVHLGWQVASSVRATGYRVQVQVDGGRWSNLPGKTLGRTVRHHVDTARRAPESLVRYRVQSLGGASGPPILSNTVALRRAAAAVPTPTAPTARCVSGGVELKWSASNGASAYEVQRAFGTADFAPRADVSRTGWTDRAIAPGKRYRYRLVGRHQMAASGVSDPVEIVCSDR